jgi:hypothetical protein
VAALLFLAPALTSAQTIDNKGTDFIMGFLPTLDSANITELHLTADAETEVTVQYPVNSPTFDETVTVSPGSITIVELPNSSSNGWADGGPQNNAVRAFADEEFVVYMINRRQASTDAALALPLDALNTDYLVQTYADSQINSVDAPEYLVVATLDDTEVTITPADGGGSVSTTLDRGEGYLVRSSTEDLSGARIEASKRVTMTNGNLCANVPPTVAACDHIFEVAQPLASWGTEALVAPLPNRPNGSVYRVLAAEDGTSVFQNGSQVATLDAGEFYDTGVIAGAHVFASNDDEKPIFVTQYMTGDSFSGASLGDPAMGNMTPSEQYLSAYTFATPGDDQFAQHYLSVIAENDDVAEGEVFFDGAVVPASAFTAIAGTDFSYAVVQIDEGSHTTSSRGVHGITVEGYNNFDSYIYPGGARFNFINQGDDLASPECDGSLDGMTFFGSASDSEADDPNNTGIFFVVLSEDSENLVLDVDDFEPGAESVSYTVSLDDVTMSGSGTVVVTDGAGNTCRQPVTILVDDPEVLACSPEAPVEFFDFDPDGGDATYGEFAGARNYGGGLAVDLDGCSFLAFDPFTEVVSYALGASGIVPAGSEHVFATTGGAQTIPDGALPDGPGAIVLAQGSFGVGASVGDVADDVVAAVVYRADDDVFGTVRGSDPETAAEALAALLAQLRQAVADEGGPEGALALSVAPNPTLDRATVAFGLAEAADVRVAVYDALGREVAVLAEGARGPGQHQATFEARGLPSGVYVVRVATGADVQTARLTVAR